ncbi:hypothetical protein PHJA_000753300 [Phtheirospermum japonicum]|uniref:Uncharacterized protein n=1 Tax=Phtheirospermum japonicum TaxID=374723 RepID=A0A830BNI4_9LAMI|nr:hypothetical protein PHJA_000753300 [Phtheirospermum japonicum]
MDTQQLSTTRRLVCFTCYCGNLGIYLFIVDLNRIRKEEGYKSMTPALQIDRQVFDASAVCVLKSTLYLFSKDSKVATLDLSKHLSFSDDNNSDNIRLTEGMLDRNLALPFPKRSPVATPTPDGKKILLFSLQIEFDASDDRRPCNPIDFELYDPDTKHWRPIPRIYYYWPMRFKKNVNPFKITAFSFHNKSTFFIDTDIAGMFELDLDTFVWRAHENPAGPWPYNFCGSGVCLTSNGGGIAFTVIELPGLCLSLGPYATFDIDESRGLTNCCIYLSEDLVDGYAGDGANDGYDDRFASGIPFRDDDDGEWKLCLVRTTLNVTTGNHLMALHVCRFDFDGYRKKK